MNEKCITKREFKKLKKECTNYKETKKVLINSLNGSPVISFDMFQDLIDLLGYYRIKEEIYSK